MKVYQIEVSNRCNLRCTYCPHPVQTRAKGFMTIETFALALELTKRCGQDSAYLHNFGEPLLHPRLPDMIRMSLAVGIEPSFYTNGALMNADNLRELEEAGLRTIWLSEHTEGELDRVSRLIHDQGSSIRIAGNFKPEPNALHDWASQVATVPLSLGPSHAIEPCLFERQNAVVVLWDGSVTNCCIDANGQGIRGTVADYLDNEQNYNFEPIPLCNGCTLMRTPEEL